MFEPGCGVALLEHIHKRSSPWCRGALFEYIISARTRGVAVCCSNAFKAFEPGVRRCAIRMHALESGAAKRSSNTSQEFVSGIRLALTRRLYFVRNRVAGTLPWKGTVIGFANDEPTPRCPNVTILLWKTATSAIV